jgi:hypothetical protein
MIMLWINDIEISDSMDCLVDRGELSHADWIQTIYEYVDDGDLVALMDIALPFVTYTKHEEYWSYGKVQKHEAV